MTLVRIQGRMGFPDSLARSKTLPASWLLLISGPIQQTKESHVLMEAMISFSNVEMGGRIATNPFSSSLIWSETKKMCVNLKPLYTFEQNNNKSSQIYK